jgi:hypothetical protein
LTPHAGTGPAARGAARGICLAAVACNTSGKPASENEQHLKALAVCYGQYVNAHRGQSPPGEAELRKFIQSLPAELHQNLAIDPANLDGLFTSPRDHQPYGVAYKATGAAAPPPPPGQGGGPMIAWEQTMDYASATPGDAPNSWDQFWYGNVWGVPTGVTYNGMIVRRDQDVPDSRGIPLTACMDGLSNTMVVSEKRLDSRNYANGDWHDDQGWIDGWDPDVVRYTAYIPQKDAPGGVSGYEFGSAHAPGIQSLFGDGSVRMIRYSVNPTVFNWLGHRQDGNAIDMNSL